MAGNTPHKGPTAIDRLARWSLAAEPAYSEPQALRQAQLLVLDSIGCAYAAIASGGVEGVVETAQEQGGPAEASVIGSPHKISAVNAVLANGALVRVLDLNDVSFAERDGALSVAGHCSDNIPVALAVGEKVGASGRAVLESIILSYELYGRLRQLMPESTPWDASSVSGLIAAAMAGRLMGLDETRQAHAIALGAARTAIPKVVRKGEMSASKSIANALVAQSGVLGALLAAKGVTGPREAIEHRDGLVTVFEPGRGLDVLWAATRRPLEIMGGNMKCYPSIGTSQCMVTAALDLREKLAGRFDDIEKIDVVMADVPTIRRQQADAGRRDPRTREAADHSFTFLPCVTLIEGELTTRQFENEKWLARPIRHLMEKVELGVAVDLRERAPGSMPCRLKVRMTDGSEIVSECLYQPGHSFPDKGLDEGAVTEKFRRVSRDVLSYQQQGRIIETILAMDGSPSISPTMEAAQAVKRSN